MRESESQSPYETTIEEVVQRFGHSRKRRDILLGFVNLRIKLLELGIQGHQWIDGSFVEDKETVLKESPNDIDCVTFVTVPIFYKLPGGLLHAIRADDPNERLMNPAYTKPTYLTDHFFVPLGESFDEIAKTMILALRSGQSPETALNGLGSAIALAVRETYRNVALETKYWYALFSHKRPTLPNVNNGVWKGMLQLPLHDLDGERAVLQDLEDTIRNPAVGP